MRIYGNRLHFERDTHADVGWITSVYLGGKSPLSGGGAVSGSWTTPPPAIRSTTPRPPPGRHLFTDNAVRQFYSRKEAAAWLLGIHDAAQEWMKYARAHPRSAVTKEGTRS